MQFLDTDLPSSKKKIYNMKPYLKSDEPDLTKNELSYSPTDHTIKIKRNLNRSIGYQNDNKESIKEERRRLYTIQKQSEEDEIYSIKKEVKQLQKQLAWRRKYQNKKSFFKINNKEKDKSRQSTLSRFYPDNPLGETRFFKLHHRRHSLWKSPQMSSHTKLYKVKSKPPKFLQDPSSQSAYQAPIISKVRFRKYRSHRPDYRQYPITFSQIFKPNWQFRKIAHVILFTIRLRKYNKRMRSKRITHFQLFVKQSLNFKLLELKNLFIQHSKPFFTTIIDNSNFSYRLHEKDQLQLKKQKVNSVHKLVNLQINCIQKCINQFQSHFSETFYLLCKHGNYSCIEQINTNEQLNLSCISQYFGYMRSDKCLEQSALLSLVFIKILLYNILLQPNTIDLHINLKTNLETIYSNIRLIGNILYEIFIDIQDQLLQKTPALYKVGNWQQLKKPLKFKVAQSMTIRSGLHIPNELISGLASHNYLKKVYRTQSMIEEKRTLTELVKLLHQNIVRYHREIQQQAFIM